MEKLYFKKSSIKTKILYVFFFVVFAIFALICLYPMFWAIVNSLKPMAEFSEGESWLLPKQWVFEHYKQVFTDFRVVVSDPEIAKYRDYYDYFDMLGNSLWILVVHVFVNVASSTMLAYALARFNFPGKNFLYAVVIFANTIPIIGSGPAHYKLAVALNFVNNPYLIWMQWASGFDFAFIVFYGYFKGISASYSESAKIEGANNLVILLKIILPQIIPCLVAISITQAVGVWNNYTISMVYMKNYPNLAYGMYLFRNGANWIADSMTIYLAAATISSVPIIILYACSQNLILTNMTTGGLKG